LFPTARRLTHIEAAVFLPFGFCGLLCYHACIADGTACIEHLDNVFAPIDHETDKNQSHLSLVRREGTP
jgi:hypothetical protein